MDPSPSETPKQDVADRADNWPILATPADLPPLPAARPIAGNTSGYAPEKVYGVTRRFSLATVMMMMAGTSLALAVMNALRVPPAVSGALVLLCIATAIGQMFLFGGKDPRRASRIVGAAFCSLTAPFLGPVVVSAMDGRHLDFQLHAGELITRMFVGAIFGAIPGYLAGCVVAGVLLVMDLTESIFVRWRKAREPDDDP